MFYLTFLSDCIFIQLVSTRSMCELFLFPHQVSMNSILFFSHTNVFFAYTHDFSFYDTFREISLFHFLSLSLSLSQIHGFNMNFVHYCKHCQHIEHTTHYIKRSFCSILCILMVVKTNYSTKKKCKLNLE